MIPSASVRRIADEEIESLVDEIRREPDRRDELVAMLHEAAGIYAGRGAASAAHVRGWIMAAFQDVGLPVDALPFVLEALHTELDPYVVAAAARAVRGIPEPVPSVVATALVHALTALRARDDTVSFDSMRQTWPAQRPTTALLEIVASLRSLGPAASGSLADLEAVSGEHADTWSPLVRRTLDATIRELQAISRPAAGHCCGSVDAEPGGERHRGQDQDLVDIGSVVFEAQDRRESTFDQVFRDRFTVVAFFYTRCPNPNKCSATITKLAELQRRLDESGLAERIGIAAITYDPGYDLADRMRAYGESRGLRFSDSVRMFRAPRQHELVQRHFALRVGYVGSIVNQHGIELFLVGDDGSTVFTWSRVQWDVETVLGKARSLQQKC